MTTETRTGHANSQNSVRGVERWLRSPVRLATLGTVAAIFATLATSLGEMELQRAAGVDTERNDVLWLQGAHWIGWVVLSLPLIKLAVYLAKSRMHAALVLLVHVPIALGVGSLFLAAEIKLQEVIQGPEDTRTAAEALRIRDERRARDAERRLLREEQSESSSATNPIDAERVGAERRQDGPPGRGAEVDPNDDQRAEGPRGRRRGRGRPGPPTGVRRLMFRAMNGSTANVATGDLTADFERRWLLRVPRYSLIYFALIGLGLGLRSFLVGRTREREASALETRTGQLRQELTDARLDALRGQLHPHFLFNALHSVGGLIRTDRNPEALTALDSVGDLLRTSLDSTSEAFVSLARELELLQRYLNVEKLRLGERLTVVLDVPSELMNAEVPAFITQPLVENAVKHGIAAHTGGGTVTVRASTRADGQLVIDIEDRGSGTAAEEPTRRSNGGGVGLDNVRGRLEALFDDAASLELTPTNADADGRSGMRARLVLPLDESFE